MEKIKALEKAMAFCARSEKSRKETARYLESLGVNAEDTGEIISKLIEEKFIDELRYAEAFARDKFRFNSWGKKKISYQLGSKGIPPDIIDQALQSLDPDEYYEELKAQLQKKLNTIRGGSYYEKKSKLLRFAAGRGYETDLIYEAVDELLHK